MKKNSMLNPVFDSLKPSSTLYINETVNRLWKQGEQVFHMGFGESRFDVHPKLQQALADHSDKKSYLPARGLPALLESIAKYYTQKLNVSFEQSQVIVGPGSKSLIYGLQMVLDADVFLPTPSWVSYAPQATLLGNQYHYIPSKVNDNYRLDIAELDRLVKVSDKPCKLLVINSPNNPTGEVMTEQALRELADYCRANDIWVLSDEIYFEVTHGSVPHCSIARFYPERTFVLGGLSKHLSIGGWRLGVALLPNTEEGRLLMGKMTVISSETWSGVSAPIQYAAIKAYSLDADIEQYVNDCREVHGIRTRHIRAQLKRLNVRCTSCNGGFYIAANFDFYRSVLRDLHIETSVDLAKHLLSHYKIATLPGSDFGIPEKTLTLRLSTSYLDMENDGDAERIMDLYKSRLSDVTFMSEMHHPNTVAAMKAFSEFLEPLTL